MPYAIQKEIEKLEKNGKFDIGSIKRYLQKGPQYIIPEIQEIYTFWNRELPGGPITFYADERNCFVEMKFYKDYETLDQDETGNDYLAKIEIQKEKKNYHLQIQSDRMEEMDVKVTIEELKKQIQAVAKEVEKLLKEE